MHPITLKAIFLSMMYVAREEGEKVDPKYYELEEWINTNHEISLTDMIDNIEHVYQMIKNPINYKNTLLKIKETYENGEQNELDEFEGVC